jgi:hypothetical protein
VSSAQQPTRSRRKQLIGVGVRVGVGLAVPSLLFYLLRFLGSSIYLALVVSTLVSAVPSLVALVRDRRVDGLSTFFTAMMLGGLVVSALPGDTRFLLAREALMTGVTGVWFLASIRTARPLTYHFTKPLLEGRFRWPGGWDQLWQHSPRFRRMWRVSSVLWAIGLLADAVLRVVLAYTVRPDLVPALGLALYVVTVVALNVVVTLYYLACRPADPRSPLRREAAEAQRVAEPAT